MNELVFEKDLEMTSLEVVNLINKFRAEEGNRKELRHYDFMSSIRRELESLANAGVEVNDRNISVVEYTDKKGEKRPCYQMNRSWIMQMCNKESAFVRYKTQQYISALENRITEMNKEIMIQNQQNIIAQKDREISQLTQFIGLKSKAKFDWGKIIKTHLGIRKANADYESIKQIFFFEVGVRKWEDIYPSMQNVKLLRRICEEYQPSKQRRFF